MRRGVAAIAGLAVVTAAVALLTRPLMHSLGADTVTVSLLRGDEETEAEVRLSAPR